MSSKNKKKSVKFTLVPRPQRDPLAADIEAPQHVLVPKGGASIEEIKQKLPDFDSDLFQSEKETRVGMLERAHNANGLTFDSDILQAMSKDFDYEDPNNVIDDDFIDQAGGLIEDEGEMLDDEMTDLTKELFDDDPEVITFDQQDGSGDESYESDEYDLDRELLGEKNESTSNQGRRLILFKKKANKQASRDNRRSANDSSNHEYDDNDDARSDSKTVFTNYSMTSSVVRRNQGLQQIDEHFERLFEKEYADDTEIGALDLNEIKGDELLTNMEQIKQMKAEVKATRQRNHGDDYIPEIVSDHHKNAIIGDEPDAENDDLVEMEFTRRENRVDCESILSYNSNLFNHPKLIVEPRKRNRTQDSQMDTEEQSDIRSRSGHSQSIASSRATILSKLSVRPSGESSEERRARKKALKEYRQERRKERKQNQLIFKSEKTILARQATGPKLINFS